MQPTFNRIVLQDHWLRFHPVRWPASWFVPPRPAERIEFLSYVLGFRWEASDRELSIIGKKNMWSEAAVRLRETDAAITLRDILGPEWVPEIGCSPDALMNAEMRVRQAALCWTQYLEGMPDE